MWIAIAAALGFLALVGGIVWLVWYFGADAREIERELGRARGEIARLQGIIDERTRELEACRIALEHALRPRPTLDDLERVSDAAAGDSAAAGAAAEVDVPGAQS